MEPHNHSNDMPSPYSHIEKTLSPPRHSLPKILVTEDGRRKRCRHKEDICMKNVTFDYPPREHVTEGHNEPLKENILQTQDASQGMTAKNTHVIMANKIQASLPKKDEEDDATSDVDIVSDKREIPRCSVEVYLAACRRYDVVPARQVREHLHEQVLRLNHLNLTHAGVTPLAVALVHDTQIVSLQLSENSIGERGIRDLCDMLTRNNTITSIDLSENKLGLTGAKHIARLLAQNKTLTTLNISGNDFKDSGIPYITSAIKKNRGLRTLILSHNHLDERAGILLGDALSENEFLQNLDLKWNHLREKGALAFVRALKDNSSLQTLDLSWNGFSDKGARAVGQYLAENDSLREIDLSSNRVHREGATALAKSIARNSTLQVLKLSKNPIASKGACQILEAILSNVDSQIDCFEIMDVEINAHFEVLLGEVRAQGRRLEVIHGGTVTDDPYGQPARRVAATMGDPATLLFSYAKTSGLRLIDLFAQFDVDNSSTVSHEEFKLGLKRTRVPLSELQVEKLITQLDVDGDGEIDFREFMEGQRQFRDRERRRQRAMSPQHMTSERLMTSGLSSEHAALPRVASPRLTMTSPLGRASLMNARRDSERQDILDRTSTPDYSSDEELSQEEA